MRSQTCEGASLVGSPHTHTCTLAYTLINIMYICMHYSRTHARTRTHMHTHARICTHTHARTHARTHAHAYAHADRRFVLSHPDEHMTGKYAVQQHPGEGYTVVLEGNFWPSVTPSGNWYLRHTHTHTHIHAHTHTRTYTRSRTGTFDTMPLQPITRHNRTKRL